MTTTVLWPIPRDTFWISSTWSQHLARPNYNRAYAGTDLAASPRPIRAVQYGGKVLQAMWNYWEVDKEPRGYGWTTFVEYAGKLRIRDAHLSRLSVNTGQLVNVGDELGILDSTGGSSGNHDHFETWLLVNGRWMNVDPLNPSSNIQMVNNPELVIPLDGTVITPPAPSPSFVPPEPAVLKDVTPAPLIVEINLRAYPRVSGARIGKVRKGEVWKYIDNRMDLLGNYWYALMRGDAIGWAAAYYNGEVWLVEV